jgi:hypothetical protein
MYFIRMNIEFKNFLKFYHFYIYSHVYMLFAPIPHPAVG